MSVRTVRCVECESTRAARLKDDETVPYRDECPDCGCTSFVDVLDETESEFDGE